MTNQINYDQLIIAELKNKIAELQKNELNLKYRLDNAHRYKFINNTKTQLIERIEIDAELYYQYD